MRSKVLVRIDRLLVKPVPVAVKMMPDAEMERYMMVRKK